MALLQTAVLAIGLVSSVSAQVLGDTILPVTATAIATASVTAPIVGASIVSIYFPGADKLPYVASLIGQSNGAQTLAISCGPGVDSDTCGFPSSVTVTAGPSTAYVSVSNQEATFIYDCKISASTTAVCAETFNGDAAYIATTTGKAAPTGSTSSVLTETLASTDITWMPITITAWGKGVTVPTSTPTATPSTSKGGQQSQSNPSNGGNNPWGNVNIPSGSSNQPSVSTPWGSQVTPTTAPTATTPMVSSKTGIWPITYTGAAQKVGVYGNYAAGLLALAGLAL